MSVGSSSECQRWSASAGTYEDVHDGQARSDLGGGDGGWWSEPRDVPSRRDELRPRQVGHVPSNSRPAHLLALSASTLSHCLSIPLLSLHHITSDTFTRNGNDKSGQDPAPHLAPLLLSSGPPPHFAFTRGAGRSALLPSRGLLTGRGGGSGPSGGGRGPLSPGRLGRPSSLVSAVGSSSVVSSPGVTVVVPRDRKSVCCPD